MSAQSETAARDYGPGQKYYAASNPLSRSATQAVIQAARAAGEPEEAVRELGRRLNLNEVELLLLDLSPPEKIKTEDALEILKQAYELRGADSFWYDLARTMGLDPESEQIQKLAEQLRRTKTRSRRSQDTHIDHLGIASTDSNGPPPLHLHRFHRLPPGPVVHRVIAEAANSRASPACNRVAAVAGGKDRRYPALADPLVQHRRGYAQDGRSVLCAVGAADVQLRRHRVNRNPAYR